MIPASRYWLRTGFLWLALAVVLTCALGSFGSPVRASSGSAFNAFTSDVSLGPQRASEPEKDRKEQAPASGGRSGDAGMFPLAAAALPPRSPQAVRLSAKPILAPPAHVTAGGIGARAPPLT